MSLPRVLLVEDDDLVATSLAKQLRVNGRLDVTVVATVLEATSVIDADQLDGVIADLQLPDDGAGGWSVVARARATDPAVEAMLITGSGPTSSANRAQREGVRFLAKPIDVDDLRPFYDGVWARLSGIGHLSSIVTGIADRAQLTTRQRQLLVLLVAGKREDEIVALTGYTHRTYSDHLVPVMRAVAAATGREVRFARDVPSSVLGIVLRSNELASGSEGLASSSTDDYQSASAASKPASPPSGSAVQKRRM